MQPGTRVGSCEVIGRLGAGGMGEVYRARDLTLGREVAIKVLPHGLSDDADRLTRFEREARALAALNHPNIAAIYGVETTPLPALILELVQGADLGDHLAMLPNGRPRVRAVLQLAMQIADGLDAAHERGVIHRDLKPSNIKVTPEGTVKLLDFGLAKNQIDNEVDISKSPTITVHGTQEGVIVGTAAYMSPEQARGRNVDKRTDIWSFGCVLYEMLAGTKPFAGETTSDLIAAILEREPDLAKLPSFTPPGVRRLLQRCLDKDARRRLRDIGDARAEIEHELSLVDAPAPSSIDQRQRLSPWLAGIALVALAGATGIGWTVARRVPSASAPRFDHMARIVATAAHEFSPVISPDGKWIAYLSNARGKTDVWVKFIAGGDPVNLTAATGIEVQSTDYINSIDISPDGTQIAFTAIDGDQQTSSWVIPAPVGGVPRKVLAGGNAGMRWSPDGKHIVFVRTGGPLGDALVIADPDGQNERIVAERRGAIHMHWPQWSPDGAYIYFNRGPQNFNIEPTEIYRVPVTGGSSEPVVATARRAVFPAFSRDGAGMVFAGNPDTVDLNFWWRDGRTGKDTRLTAGIGEYAHPQLSADGQRLVGTIVDAQQALYRVQVSSDKTPSFEPITDGHGGDFDPAYMPDGVGLVFSSSRSGARSLWLQRDPNRAPSPLTSGVAIDERPTIAPDGKTIAFVSDRGGHRGLWTISSDGGTPRLVAAANVIDTLSWSPDGKRLVFSTPVGDRPGLTIMDAADGQTTRLATPAAANAPAWSVNDEIAFIEPRGGVLGAYVQLIHPDGSKVASSQLDGAGAPRLGNGSIVWSHDGKRLAVCSLPGAGSGSIWIVDPKSPSPYRKLMELPSGVFVRGMTWARDGASLIVGTYRWSGDIFLADRTSDR